MDSGASFCKIEGHTKEVNSCAFNEEFFVTCSGDKSIRVHSAKNFQEKSYSPLLAHKYAVNCVTFDSTGMLMASASTDGTARIWHLSENGAKVALVFRHSDSNTVQVCSFSPNSALFVTGSSDGGIGIWSIENKKKLSYIEGHPEGNVNAACFTPCNDYLVTGSAVGDVRVWDLRCNNFCILQTQAHDKGVSGCGVDCICFSPTFHLGVEGEIADNYLMASCGQDNQIKLWLFKRSIAAQAARLKDPSSRCLQPLHELTGHHGPVSQCCFSPDGVKLASSSFDKTVILWSTVGGEQLMVLEGHSAIVTCVRFSCDGRYLASTSYDKTTIVWKLTGDDDIMTSTETSAVNAVNSGTNGIANDPQLPSAPPQIPTTSQPPSKRLHEWTTGDVVAWLENDLKLTQYSTAFSENEIDGDELVNLTAEVLSGDLGVTPLGHRNKILRGIKALQAKDSMPTKITPVTGHTPKPEFMSSSLPPLFTSALTQPTVTVGTNVGALRDNQNIPDEYLCPISREIMIDPVLAPDGFSYERTEIESWFRGGSMMSPMTNAKLSSRTLVPNQALRNLIMQFLESKNGSQSG